MRSCQRIYGLPAVADGGNEPYISEQANLLVTHDENVRLIASSLLPIIVNIFCENHVTWFSLGFVILILLCLLFAIVIPLSSMIWRSEGSMRRLSSIPRVLQVTIFGRATSTATERRETSSMISISSMSRIQWKPCEERGQYWCREDPTVS